MHEPEAPCRTVEGVLLFLSVPYGLAMALQVLRTYGPIFFLPNRFPFQMLVLAARSSRGYPSL